MEQTTHPAICLIFLGQLFPWPCCRSTAALSGEALGVWICSHRRRYRCKATVGERAADGGTRTKKRTFRVLLRCARIPKLRPDFYLVPTLLPVFNVASQRTNPFPRPPPRPPPHTHTHTRRIPALLPTFLVIESLPVFQEPPGTLLLLDASGALVPFSCLTWDPALGRIACLPSSGCCFPRELGICC